VHAAEEVAPEIEMEAEFESEPPPPSTESINQLAALSSSIGRLALKQVRREEPIVELPVRARPTEIIVPHTNGELIPPAGVVTFPARRGGRILRAMTPWRGYRHWQLVVQQPEPRRGGRCGGRRMRPSTSRVSPGASIASQAAGAAAVPRQRRARAHLRDYDDALGDIDSTVGIDTIAGHRRRRARRRAGGAAAFCPRAETFVARVVPPRRRHRVASAANQREETEGRAHQGPSTGESRHARPSRIWRRSGSLHASAGPAVRPHRGDARRPSIRQWVPVFATRAGERPTGRPALSRRQRSRASSTAHTELGVEPGRRTRCCFVELG